MKQTVFTIRKFKKSDAKEAALLVAQVFKKYNHREATSAALKRYINYIHPNKNSPERLLQIFARTPICFVAVNNKKIIGVIRGRINRINNLFVDGKYHHQGVGRALILRFENETKKYKVYILKVRASLYATPFYQKMGYKKTTGVRNFHGIKMQPMKKKLS